MIVYHPYHHLLRHYHHHHHHPPSLGIALLNHLNNNHFHETFKRTFRCNLSDPIHTYIHSLGRLCPCLLASSMGSTWSWSRCLCHLRRWTPGSSRRQSSRPPPCPARDTPALPLSSCSSSLGWQSDLHTRIHIFIYVSMYVCMYVCTWTFVAALDLFPFARVMKLLPSEMNFPT